MFGQSATIALCCVLLAVVAICNGHVKRRFDNHQVFSINVETEEQIKALRQLQDSHLESGISVWNGLRRRGHSSDVLVAPHKLAEFNDMLSRLGLKSTLVVKNVQKLIDDQQPTADDEAGSAFDWTRFRTFGEINAWLDTLLVTHADVLTNIVIGESYENRTIRALKISHKPGNPAVIIEANIHAREWITSATATWILNELLTSQEVDVVELAQNIDWYIVPVLNVDGFVYSHETNRMWRKTRQPHSIFCHGADPNRNFNRAWAQQGTSQNPCSDLYAGPTSESEPEIAAYVKFYQSISHSVKLYMSFHAAGQYILTPYGYTSRLPENHYDIMLVALRAKEAIAKREGRQYIVGPIAEVMYEASGNSIDWANDVEGTMLTYAFEFRDDRNGHYGFLLPADQIVPNALESFDGIKAMIAEARLLKYL